MKGHFRKLYKHVAWADARVLQSLRSAHAVLKRDLDLYSHILGSEHVWLSRIKGTTAQVAVWPSLTFDEAERLAGQNIAAFNEVISELTEEGRETQITYRNSAGEQFTSTLEDILTHVSLHGAYHRGQIAASIRAAGDVPSPTDYIAFARGVPAATRKA
ncbi:MAG TPA: DinB family protein [Gemmatimonadaceae bacterium]|nr:DinB family protein [Gemmatimonadaceae bacterium]